MKEPKFNPEKELPDFLENCRKENPFQVPYNYFKELPDNIHNRVYEEMKRDQSNSLLIWINEFWRQLYSLKLAWVVGIIIILLVAIPAIIDKADLPANDFDLEADEIALYIKANIDDFDEELFYNADPDQIELFPELEVEEDQVEQMIEDLLQDMDVESLKEML